MAKRWNEPLLPGQWARMEDDQVGLHGKIQKIHLTTSLEPVMPCKEVYTVYIPFKKIPVF
jgi:hypothetical protein